MLCEFPSRNEEKVKELTFKTMPLADSLEPAVDSLASHIYIVSNFEMSDIQRSSWKELSFWAYDEST